MQTVEVVCSTSSPFEVGLSIGSLPNNAKLADFDTRLTFAGWTGKSQEGYPSDTDSLATVG